MLENVANLCTFNMKRTHRYVLARQLMGYLGHNDAEKLSILWVMLNPSTADEAFLDPTVAKCAKYSYAWGFAGLVVVNLFSLRATNPRQLKTAMRPEGDPENMFHILHQAEMADMVVVAYGNHGGYEGRHKRVLHRLLDYHERLYALGLNKTGHPVHPLYQLDSRKLFPVVVTSEGLLEREIQANGESGQEDQTQGTA